MFVLTWKQLIRTTAPNFSAHLGFWSDKKSHDVCEPDNPSVQTLVGKVHLSEMTAASLKQPSVGGRQEVTR